ncbi:uncharacterized protein LOC128881192 [Hylaeus volcanicus]|uniref:uncharacterized protein LOC128881192 n=1 Tax=Hylaeus volcanicus TaxID=313075 RepID=UPI0023B78B29|nr:uncharacterized protein LOC128881192 [Hylaeus volcanicus]
MASPWQQLGDYCFEKLSKLRALKLKIPDAYLEDAVISSIGDETIERTIRSNRYENVDELHAVMKEMGSMPRATAQKMASPRQRGPMNEIEPTTSTSTAKPTSSTTAEDTRRRAVTCFNCGEVGHYSGRCPSSPVTCKSCSRQGHLNRFCSRLKGMNTT